MDAGVKFWTTSLAEQPAKAAASATKYAHTANRPSCPWREASVPDFLSVAIDCKGVHLEVCPITSCPAKPVRALIIWFQNAAIDGCRAVGHWLREVAHAPKRSEERRVGKEGRSR